MRLFVFFAFLITSFTSAQAEWYFQKNESAFSDEVISLAFTAKGNYAMGIRCSGPEKIELVFMTPDKSLEEYGHEVVNSAQPELLIRIDKGSVLEEVATVDLAESGAIFRIEIDRDTMLEAKQAATRIAVALRLLGDMYHETTFSVRGSTRQLTKLQDACAL